MAHLRLSALFAGLGFAIGAGALRDVGHDWIDLPAGMHFLAGSLTAWALFARRVPAVREG